MLVLRVWSFFVLKGLLLPLPLLGLLFTPKSEVQSVQQVWWSQRWICRNVATLALGKRQTNLFKLEHQHKFDTRAHCFKVKVVMRILVKGNFCLLTRTGSPCFTFEKGFFWSTLRCIGTHYATFRKRVPTGSVRVRAVNQFHRSTKQQLFCNTDKIISFLCIFHC